MSDVAKGDQYQSLDTRNPTPRIVRVTAVGAYRASVETVEHWNEKLVDKPTRPIRLDRLANPRLWKKISH